MDSPQRADADSQPTYRGLLIYLEHRLGTCNLLVSRAAKEPADLLLPTGVLDRLVREMARAIYKSNRCYHIRATVNEDASLRALAPFLESLADNPQHDLETARLTFDLHAGVKGYFGGAAAGTGRTGHRLSRGSADIITLRRRVP